MLVFFLTVAFTLFTNDLQGQDYLQNKKIIFEKKFDEPIKDAFVRENTIYVQLHDNSNSYFVILDKNGNELIRKPYATWESISISERGNRILIPYFRNQKPGTPYYVINYDADILDNSGRKISELIDVSSHRLKISSNGRYVITITNSGGEEASHFELYDIEKAEKINLPKEFMYNYFFADFLSNNKIILLIQPVNPDSYTLPAAKIMIYNIIEHNIEIESDLYTTNGNKFWFSEYSGFFKVSKNKNLIILGGNNLPFNKRKATIPYCLLLLNINGKVIWEKIYTHGSKIYEGYENAIFVNEHQILIEEFNLVESWLHLYDFNSNNKKWSYKIDPMLSLKISESNIDNSNKNIYVNSKKGLWEFDGSNGKLIENYQNIKYAKMNYNSSSTVIIYNDCTLRILGN